MNEEELSLWSDLLHKNSDKIQEGSIDSFINMKYNYADVPVEYLKVNDEGELELSLFSTGCGIDTHTLHIKFTLLSWIIIYAENRIEVKCSIPCAGISLDNARLFNYLFSHFKIEML